MKLKIFCRCSLFSSWSGKDLSARLYRIVNLRWVLDELCGPCEVCSRPALVWSVAMSSHCHVQKLRTVDRFSFGSELSELTNDPEGHNKALSHFYSYETSHDRWR